jgi:RNA polymerase sigma factor (sigma-70 family)
MVLAKQGNKKAMGELVHANTPFIAQVIKEFTLPGWVSMEDVLQEGKIGMMDAVMRFKIDSGFALCTYAYWRIKKAIVGYMTEMGYPLKIPFPDVVKLKKVINRLDLGLSQTPEADAKIVNLSKNVHIQNLLSGCLPIHPTVHGSGGEGSDFVDVGTGFFAAMQDAALSTGDMAETVMGAMLSEAIVEKLSELTLIEGVMLGQHLGMYIAKDQVPLKHIAGEKSRILRKEGEQTDIVGGLSGFGLECGESYNNCSKLIKQAEAKLRHLLVEFLGEGLYDDYLEKSE